MALPRSGERDQRQRGEKDKARHYDGCCPGCGAPQDTRQRGGRGAEHELGAAEHAGRGSGGVAADREDDGGRRGQQDAEPEGQAEQAGP